MVDANELFGSSPKPTVTVRRDRWGRYLLPCPGATKEQPFQRVTTFIKMASDTYNLEAWSARNVAKGVAMRPDLAARASTLDIKANSKELNEIVREAKEVAGSRSAANMGTAIHNMSELWDSSRRDEVPEAHRPLMTAYQEMLDQHGINMVPELMERITVDCEYEVAGTFDRVGVQDGKLRMMDIKTGSVYPDSFKEYAIQLWEYVKGVNTSGIWDPQAQEWDELEQKVEEDFGYIIHLPADGSGCSLYKVDLEIGREGAAMCAAVRLWRSKKVKPEKVGDEVAQVYGDVRKSLFMDSVGAAKSMDDLVKLAGEARAAGIWDVDLSNACKREAKKFG